MRPHEGCVDHAQDRLGGAEAVLQVEPVQPRARRFQPLREMLRHQVEALGIGTLERVDRLLLVADHEDRAIAFGLRALARGELLRQPLDHRPLRRARVLRLVDEDVVDAAIEPEQHPLRHRRIGQQLARLADQVVEIEHAAQELAPLIGGHEGAGEGVEIAGLGKGVQRQARAAALLDPGHQVFEPLDQRRVALAQLLGRELADLGPERRRGGGAEQQQAFQQVQQGGPGGGLEIDGVEPVGGLLVGDRALAQQQQQRVEGLEIVRFETDLVKPLQRQPGGQVEIPREGGVVRLGQERLAPRRDLAQQFVEIALRGLQRQRVDEGPLGALRHRVDHLGAQKLRGAVLHLGELRADPGFERKPPEQTRAEGVDRLDPQAPRRLDGAGEQRAGRAQRDRMRRAELLQRAAQAGILHHRPFAQAPEQAVLHLGGGGLGVGQAQDVLRIGAVEQQPRHPVGQHPGLAGARIGRKPGGIGRVGGADLPLGRVVADHPTSSPSAACEKSHSPKRDRWS